MWRGLASRLDYSVSLVFLSICVNLRHLWIQSERVASFVKANTEIVFTIKTI
jgi:hypothetical protein